MSNLAVALISSLFVLYQFPKYRAGFHGNMSKEYLVKQLCFVSAGAAFIMAVMFTLMLFSIGEANGEIAFVNKDVDEYEIAMVIPITIIVYYLFSSTSKIWDLLFPSRQANDY